MRPTELDNKNFINDLKFSQNITNALRIKKLGYRAPCFSLGREKLDCLISTDLFLYDSSMIEQKEHPLYTKLDLTGFRRIRDSVFKKDDFYELEVSTYKFLNFNLPISGGGYLRIIPWPIYKFFLKLYLKKSRTYLFYIHPFELSNQRITLPNGTNLISKFRFCYNRKKTLKKIQKTINLLKELGYEFKTYTDLIDENSNNRC